MVVFIGIVLLTAAFTVRSLINESLIKVWYDLWIALPIGFGWFLAFTAAYFAFLYLLSLTIDLEKPVTKRSGFYHWLLKPNGQSHTHTGKSRSAGYRT